MYLLQWNWPCIFTATEVVGQITDYQFTMQMHISYMYGSAFYTQSNAGQ